KKLGFFGTGIVTGICITFALIGVSIARNIYVTRRLTALSNNGERVLATVESMQSRKVRRVSFENDKKWITPVMIHYLTASWRHPKTGRIHLLKTPVKDPGMFTMGSTVPFLVDLDHPHWHRLEQIQDAAVGVL
ncbi:MAG TPA: hypothetical protein VH593_17995, partial [Ktedonobacteraceae bacterium]